MGNSLQDQLLKAGLSNKNKAAKARKANRVAERDKRAGRAPTETETQRLAREAAEAKAERDRELNRQQNEARAAEETAAQARNIVEHARLDLGSADTAFNFTDNGVIKTLDVTAEQHRHLAAGHLAVAQAASGYALIPSVAALKVQSRLPEIIVCWHQDQADDAPTEDDPYAAYEIPDDLMW